MVYNYSLWIVIFLAVSLDVVNGATLGHSVFYFP